MHAIDRKYMLTFYNAPAPKKICIFKTWSTKYRVYIITNNVYNKLTRPTNLYKTVYEKHMYNEFKYKLRVNYVRLSINNYFYTVGLSC